MAREKAVVVVAQELIEMAAPLVHADNAAQAEYWNSAAGQRWTDRQDHQDQVLQPVSDRLLAAANPRSGDRVIDVGCGCGATTLDFAARVTPDGEALGLDLSEPMLARARERALPGLPARFVLADATVHALAPGKADLVVSRFGVMFFADPARSFANLRKGLKPGGRLVFACWREAKRNPWMTLPLREAGKHAPPLPESGPEEPGPFAFADEARVRRILGEAGYAEIVLTPQELDLDIAAGRGLDTAVASALAIGPTSRMLDGQSEEVRAAAVADIRAALAARAVGDRGRSAPPSGSSPRSIEACEPHPRFPCAENARMVKPACSGPCACSAPTGQARRARQPPSMHSPAAALFR